MELLDVIQIVGIPQSIFIVFLIIFLILQGIGELLSVCGKTIPAFLRLVTYIKAARAAKKEAELQKLQQDKQIVETLAEVKSQQEKVADLIADFNKHYDEEHIAKRDKWMLEVNSTMHWAKERAVVYDKSVDELKELTQVVKKQSKNIEKQQSAIDLNNRMTSDMYKQSCRTDILNFSHKIINARKYDKPLIISREEFRKIRKTYDAYEDFLKNYGGTNGEVTDAMEIIRKAERGEYSYIEFLEDIRE